MYRVVYHTECVDLSLLLCYTWQLLDISLTGRIHILVHSCGGLTGSPPSAGWAQRDAPSRVTLAAAPPLPPLQGGRSAKLPWTVRVRIAAQMAHALAHLHARGVIHRDVKVGGLACTQGGRSFTVFQGVCGGEHLVHLHARWLFTEMGS